MTSVGAIRWDVGGYNSLGTSDVAENDTLANPKYHDRAPFYAAQETTNSLTITATQATMDQEIAFANAGKIAYWAFLRYTNVSAGFVDAGLALYQSSSARGALKWASMEQIGSFGAWGDYTAKIPRLIVEMAQPHYQRVLGSRPLLYFYYDPANVATWFGTTANLATAITAIRTQATNAGLANPYIVLVPTGDPATSAGTVAALGCDALSAYAYAATTQINEPYAAFDLRVRAWWDAVRATGKKMIPLCMSGWNPRPRMERPQSWSGGKQRPMVGLGRVVQPATDAELVAHVQAALAYVSTWPEACEAETILAYSWNEFGEGHRPLCPTLGNPTGTHLAALAAVL